MTQFLNKLIVNEDLSKYDEKPKTGFYEYVYMGEFSEDITNHILNLTEAKFLRRKDTRGIRKRISFIIIENIQNIIRHQDVPENSDYRNKNLFVLHKTNKVIRIITGNFVKKSKKAQLEEHLSRVRDMDENEIKELYKKTLRGGEISKKGGAGLGIISMAGRTGGNFHFRFIEVNSEYSFFLLQSELFLTEKEYPKQEQEFFETIPGLLRYLDENKIMLSFRGAFAFENVESLFPLINSTYVGGFGKKRQIYNISVNLIRNIILYADRESEKDRSFDSEDTPGNYSLRQANGKIIISSGNYIYNSKALTLRNKIDLINRTEKNGLLKIRDYLDNFYPEERVGRPDISLIDMKLTNESRNIKYEIETIDQLRSFLVLQTSV
ncbi:MAG: SiaB family protein kinase [Bacteroidota bacterium]|nr:SiaB family protein kinase [Bacteroidota bacterium]